MLNIKTAVNGLMDSSHPINAADRAWLHLLDMENKQLEADYQTYREYFNGDHNVPLTDRQKEYLSLSGISFRYNFLQLPVKTMTQRLTVIGFDGDGLGGDDGILWEWWQRNRMDGSQRGVHRATARDGDTYVIVEWDAKRSYPVISHELAYDGNEGVRVTYTDSSKRRIAFASKRWREISPHDGSTWMRLNIYTPDTIYKLRSDGNDSGWTPFLDDADGDMWPLPWADSSGHPLGVPVFHNRHDDDGDNWGRSELEDLIPIQQALNKTVIDLLEGADKTAYQILTLKGGKASSIAINPRQILYHQSPDAAWGSIPAGDIDKLIRAKNDTITTLAQVSQVPLSYFQVTGQVASSATQKADDTGLVSKVEDTAVSYGNFWEDVMYMCVKLSNAVGGTSLPTDTVIKTLWGSFVRVDKLDDDVQRSQIVQNLTNAGASLDGALNEAGYSEESQERMLRGDMVDGIEQ